MLKNLEKQRQKIGCLVENRVSFNADDVVLSVYDTYADAKRVALTSSEVLFCGMLSGKKIMHVEQCDYHQPFLPNQSFVLAPAQQVYIDFPGASLATPTTCLAIEISRDKISAVAQQLNAKAAQRAPALQYHHALVHTEHNQQTQHLLARMLHLCSENGDERSYLIDLALNELIARLLQQQSRDWILSQVKATPDQCGLYAALAYLQQHLCDVVEIDALCKIACMSRSKFYAAFKAELHCTPEQWRQQKRLALAKQRLQNGESVTKVAFDLGFSHPSQFSRCFKQAFARSPKAYQTECQATH
ncbi:helix-turn-helix domain-containing protein [Pseudoalteromonas fenneropenaei]|uniref:Helix-turn-helix domain-containing protein n=1 Tax=Pseudoalteromonas fenneropenaei TaxID=1737459 RepID=A0ABV7CQ72_9GAMM